MPTETVRLMRADEVASSSTGMDMAAICARRRSAMLSAFASFVWGSRMANSSPPNRPARS